MDSPGYIALSRMVAQTRATAVTANNIANAETPGFRASHMVFGTVLERQRGVVGSALGQDLAFAQDRSTWRDTAPGTMARTGNPLDLAIGGPDGFFAVETPRGERYTRAGHFTLDMEGRVVDQEGFLLLAANGGPLRVPQGDSRIEVLGDGGLRTESGPVGTLKVVRFADPQRLTSEGDRLLSTTEAMPPQTMERPGIMQGMVEGSNVRAVVELTRMTAELREFQFVAQMVEKEGERLGSAVERILRRH